MSPIRALEQADLPEVARLYEHVMRSGSSDPPPGLTSYFERTLLRQPWADREIPSLVYTDANGSIVAFQGSSVRRARFDGRPIRIGCAGQLVAHPDARCLAVGARLLREYLNGRQDLTITDTASEPMRQMWTLLGGHMVHLSCVTWLRLLRPVTLAGWFLRERLGRARVTRHHFRPTLDTARNKLPTGLAPPAEPNAVGEELTPTDIVDHIGVVGDRVRLHLDYDALYLGWLFEELDKVTGLGSPLRQLVRARDGRVLGWYVYYLIPGGLSHVLQVAANDRDTGRVLDHMLRDAWERGAAALVGRIEPRLLEPLGRRKCVMAYAGPAALVHSRDTEIIGAVASGSSLLSRLDGEWWLQDKMVDLDVRNGATRAGPETAVAST